MDPYAFSGSNVYSHYAKQVSAIGSSLSGGGGSSGGGSSSGGGGFSGGGGSPFGGGSPSGGGGSSFSGSGFSYTGIMGDSGAMHGSN